MGEATKRTMEFCNWLSNQAQSVEVLETAGKGHKAREKRRELRNICRMLTNTTCDVMGFVYGTGDDENRATG